MIRFLNRLSSFFLVLWCCSSWCCGFFTVQNSLDSSVIASLGSVVLSAVVLGSVHK